MKKVKILNVQFDVCTKDEALGRVLAVLARPRDVGRAIVTPNPEMLLQAERHTEFRAVLNRAWLSIPDGIGILWASTFQEISKRSNAFVRFFKALGTLTSLLFFPKFCRKIFPERITGVDFMESLCSMSRGHGYKIFLLGAKPGVAERVKEFLETVYPGVNICGVFAGLPSEDDFLRIQTLVAEAAPEILFVAYGSPVQEMWISQHLHELKSVKIAMGVGGAFDFLAGERKRAPKWMQRLGLEWVFRLVQEPSRLRRIWNATIKFPLRIMR